MQQPHNRFKKTAKLLTIAVAGLAAFVLLLVLTFSIGSVRKGLLHHLIDYAGGKLPGTIQAGEATWPSMNRIEISKLVWADQGDTLGAADRMMIEMQILPLLRRDACISELVIEGISADIPAINKRFQAGDTLESHHAKGVKKRIFPREGSIPGLPSLSIDRLILSTKEIVIGNKASIQHRPPPPTAVAADSTLPDPDRHLASLELAGSIDFSRRHSPKLSLEKLTATDKAIGFFIKEAWIDFDLAAGKMEGRGSGSIAPDWPFFFLMNSPGNDQFYFIVSELEGIEPPDAIGLAVRVTFDQDGLELRSLQYKVLVKTPGTEDLARIPSLVTQLKRFGSLEGITATVQGLLQLQPVLMADAKIELRHNAWLEGGRAIIAYHNHIIDVDTIYIALPDLTIDGTASLAYDSITALARVNAHGTQWLQNLTPSLTVPDVLHADAVVSLSGVKENPNITMHFETRSRKGAFELNKLGIDAEIPGDRDRTAGLHLEAVTRGLAVSTNAKIDWRDNLAIRLAPFIVQDASEPTRIGLKAARTGIISYANEELSFDNIQIAGALGDIRLNGKVNRRARGSYRIHCAWPEAPEILIRSLNLSPDRSDSLRIRWRQAPPFHMSITGWLTSDSVATRNRTKGTFALPGPSVLSAVSSRSVRLDDLGPIRGSYSFATRASKRGLLYNFDLDLNATDWIDSSVVRLRGLGNALEIDTIGVAFEDLKFELNGSVQESVWNLHSTLDMQSAGLLRRLDLKNETLDIAVHAKTDFKGSFHSPILDASLAAHALGSNYRIPKIAATLHLSEQGLNAAIDVSEGLAIPVLRLARLSASYRSEMNHRHLLPGEFTIRGYGSNIDFFQMATIDKTPDQWTLIGDSLSFILSGKNLRTSRPFHFRYLPSEEKIEINNLHLAGSLGVIRAEGFSGPTDADLGLSADVIFPDIPSSLRLPASLWPERLILYLKAAGKSLLRAEATVNGVTLPDNSHPDVKIRVANAQDTLRAQLSVTNELDSIVTCRLELPASLRIFPLKALLHDGPLHCDAVLNNFPIPTEVRSEHLPGTRNAKCNVNLFARGTTRDPSFFAKGRITFPGWPKLSNYHMDLEAQLASGKNTHSITAGSEIVDLNRMRERIGGSSLDGFAALLTIRKDKRQLLEATSLLPLTLTVSPLIVEINKDREFQFRMNSEELTLSEFDALLPPHMGIDGKCKFSFGALGLLENPDLTGLLSVREFQLSLEDGSRVSAQGDLQLEGSAKHPSLMGAIEIQNGILRIPDPPKDLHPSEGSAILWEHLATDTVSEQPVVDEQFAQPKRSPVSMDKDKVEAEINATIRIPSGLWVRGQGLNVELAGELHLVQKGLYPTVAGELRAIRGNLILIGRNFNMEKGSVGFFGEDKIDPSLDITLSTKVEGVLIRIAFRGTVQKPELILTSEPEMTEGDIISFLLFGKSVDELDHEQANMLQRRASELAASFGLAQLELRLSRQLGVDMVSIQRSKRDEKRKSLIIGKYLSRRALLKYEQMLEEQAGFFVNLEYFLTRHFKIETILGMQYQSGIEADWTKEY